ncbi:MAG: DUF1329 domain-containing protein [Nevskia sp.]|nr:DUF1329 domain-containing protein [Nevskia sp.]
MSKRKAWLTAAAAALFSGAASAAGDAQIARLGQDLTPIGAEKAGNKDGSIPAWTGGDTKVPAGWKPGQVRPDPYAAEKPLFSVSAANASQYQARLSPGQLELLKTIKGYRMDVYPTHRSCGYPELVYQRTKENASLARIAGDGFELAAATGSGFPFPLPASGVEAMWNHKLRYEGQGRIEPNYTLLSPAKGSSDFTKIEYVAKYLVPFQAPDTRTVADANGVEFYFYQETTAPPALAGTLQAGVYYLQKLNEGWQYFPGQRRVRRLSTYAYDAPLIGLENTYYVDQAWMYNGMLDRYTYKLVGKQELYIPYDSFALRDGTRFNDKTLFGADHLNPDARRYELHRVWKIEAEVRPGQRHSSPHRVFYLDEDTWAVVLVDMYDAQNKLQRVQEGSVTPIWEIGACDASQDYVSYDLPSGRYWGDIFTIGEPETDWLAGKEGRLKADMFTEDYLRRQGAR